MREQFIRTQLILGEGGIERLANSRVAVFGLGGVGSFCAEALARAGVGALDLIDNDVITVSNINRQLYALHSTVGKAKTAVAAARIADINPACKVRVHNIFYLPETADMFDFNAYDYIVDAVDTVSAKLTLAENAYRAGTPVISCMGTGNKLNPTAFLVADIFKTDTDPLARVMRKELKKRGVPALKVVYSPEKAHRGDADLLAHLMQTELGADSSRRDIPGSISFVPSVAGLTIAGEVIKDLCGDV